MNEIAKKDIKHSIDMHDAHQRRSQTRAYLGICPGISLFCPGISNMLFFKNSRTVTI